MATPPPPSMPSLVSIAASAPSTPPNEDSARMRPLAIVKAGGKGQHILRPFPPLLRPLPRPLGASSFQPPKWAIATS